MRYLLSSILFILCFSCASYPKKSGFTETVLKKKSIANPYFSDKAKDYFYKANIVAFGNSFGGIFIVKKLGEDHHRIAFTTEMGNKIFDFTFQGDDFKVNQIVKKLDKKILINVLKNDFRVLITESFTIEKTFEGLGFQNVYQTRDRGKKLYFFESHEEIFKILKTKNGKEKKAYFFSMINGNFAKHIEIINKKESIRINLKSISNEK